MARYLKRYATYESPAPINVADYVKDVLKEYKAQQAAQEARVQNDSVDIN